MRFWKLVPALVGLCLLCGGCSATMGHCIPNTQFAYPNSNITPLGPVEGTFTKTTWFIEPAITVGDIRKAYNDALAKQEGANISIDCKEDTTFTTVPFLMINTIEYRIQGTAAKMEVGNKTLK